MTTGEYIRWCRMGNNEFGKKWSQEEIGKLLNPPVNRAAIHKWETGYIKNIKKQYIEQLADIFGIQPSDLMCFESKYDEAAISEEVKVIESVQKLFGRQAVQILQYFSELNDIGKEKLLDDVADMVELSKYTENSR